jgi:hypothetical protein
LRRRGLVAHRQPRWFISASVARVTNARTFFSSCFFRPLTVAFNATGSRSRNRRQDAGRARSIFAIARSASSWKAAPASVPSNVRLKYSAQSSITLRPPSSSDRNGFARSFHIAVPLIFSS